MAHRGNRHLAAKAIHDDALKDGSLKVAPHTTGPVTSRKKQAVDNGKVDGIPRRGLKKLRRARHVSVSCATARIGSEEAADTDNVRQPWHETPWIKAVA